MELLQPSTACLQDADLCHFFLTISFFSSYNPDHINTNRDVQRAEVDTLHKDKEIILTQKMAQFQQSSQKDSVCFYSNSAFLLHSNISNMEAEHITV